MEVLVLKGAPLVFDCLHLWHVETSRSVSRLPTSIPSLIINSTSQMIISVFRQFTMACEHACGSTTVSARSAFGDNIRERLDALVGLGKKTVARGQEVQPPQRHYDICPILTIPQLGN